MQLSANVMKMVVLHTVGDHGIGVVEKGRKNVEDSVAGISELPQDLSNRSSKRKGSVIRKSNQTHKDKPIAVALLFTIVVGSNGAPENSFHLNLSLLVRWHLASDQYLTGLEGHRGR